MQVLSGRMPLILSLALVVSIAVNVLALQDPTPKKRAAGDHRPEAAWLEPAALSGPAATPQIINASRGPEAANGADIIRAVQRELNARNYDAGQADGVAGLVTRAAVMAYEHDYNLPLTAEPSEDLLSRIVLGSSAPQSSGRAGQPPSAEAESLIRMVKQNLAALGYQPGRIDGSLAPEAQRAIREFEVDQKLGESGRISGPMMARLLRLQGQTAPARAEPAKSKASKTTPAKAPPTRPQKSAGR